MSGVKSVSVRRVTDGDHIRVYPIFYIGRFNFPFGRALIKPDDADAQTC